MSKHDQAIADYSNAIQLENSYAEAYNGRGKSQAALGNFPSAIQDYNFAVSLIRPTNVGNIPDSFLLLYLEVLANRGDAFYSSGRYQDAIASYDELRDILKALRLPKASINKYIGFVINRGKAFYDLGDKESARGNFEELVSWLDCNSHSITAQELDRALCAEAFYNLGNIYVALNDRQKAIGNYTSAIQYQSDFAEAYYGRGNARAELSQIQEALQDYQSAFNFYQEQGKTAEAQAVQSVMQQLQQR